MFLFAMSQPPFKAVLSAPEAYCHCISRVVTRDFVFETEEMECALNSCGDENAFPGLRVIAYSTSGSNPDPTLMGLPVITSNSLKSSFPSIWGRYKAAIFMLFASVLLG